MTELQEITTGKNYAQLKKELNFQLKNGETLGGTICSHIVHELNKLKSKRLIILENSLVKKTNQFNDKLQNHFDTVKQANGQPLNDKRNGHATLRKWDKQNDSLRALDASIEKTKAAIEHEEGKIIESTAAQINFPIEILQMLESGKLNQWRKHPNYFFVAGVDKARIIWDNKKKVVMYKYLSRITDREQYKIFAATYNELNKAINKK